MNDAPIGVFDSGSGGLSIVQSLRTLVSCESILYVGDHSQLPYGDKSKEFIRERVLAGIHFLKSQKCKLIVIACNTATVAGIEYYRKHEPTIPIVGVVPVVKTAAAKSKTKCFVVLSTQFTAESLYQKSLIKQWANDCTVINLGSSKLVPLIETGKTDSEEITRELQTLFDSAKGKSFDVVVLGCTHYPFIRPAIEKIVGKDVEILDSSNAVARQVQQILTARNALAQGSSTNQFFTTGNQVKVSSVFGQLLKRAVTVSHVTL